MNPIPYSRQHISQEDIDAVVAVMGADFLTQGPKVLEFETAFAKYVGADYAVAVSNGTAALHLSALALNVKPGDKVITTPITFAASANCVRYCGGDVVFADIDPDTYILDIQKVATLLKKAAPGTYQGIIPVDFTGFPVDLEAFKKLADQYGLWMIEDACHAPGAYFTDSKGQKQLCGSGVYADLAIFSFHPVKHIAAGEGGMVTTNNKELYEKLLLLRSHGITKDPQKMHENHGGWFYEMQELGYNYRLPDILAALGLSQLNKAKPGIIRRQEIAQKYHKAFKSLPLQLPTEAEGKLNAYHLYVVQTERRLELYNFLKQHQIFTQVHYIPVHTLPYYRFQTNNKQHLPVAEAYYKRCLSLPLYPSMHDEEQDYVIEKVKEFFK